MEALSVGCYKWWTWWQKCMQCALARCRAVEKVHLTLLQWCGGGVYKCKEYIGIMKEQWGHWLVFAQGPVLLGNLRYSGIRLGHISGSLLVQPLPPHILHVHPKHLTVYMLLYLAELVSAVSQSILTDCWVPVGGAPSWSTNRSHPSFLGTLLWLFLHNFLTSCILRVMANIVLTFSVWDIFRDTAASTFDADAVCCRSSDASTHQTPVWTKSWGYQDQVP